MKRALPENAPFIQFDDLISWEMEINDTGFYNKFNEIYIYMIWSCILSPMFNNQGKTL